MGIYCNAGHLRKPSSLTHNSNIFHRHSTTNNHLPTRNNSHNQYPKDKTLSHNSDRQSMMNNSHNCHHIQHSCRHQDRTQHGSQCKWNQKHRQHSQLHTQHMNHCQGEQLNNDRLHKHSMKWMYCIEGMPSLSDTIYIAHHPNSNHSHTSGNHSHHTPNKMSATVGNFCTSWLRDRIQANMTDTDYYHYNSYTHMNNPNIHHYGSSSHEHTMYKQMHPDKLHKGTHNPHRHHCQDTSHEHNQNNIEMHYKPNMKQGIAGNLMLLQGRTPQHNLCNSQPIHTSYNLYHMQYNYHCSHNSLSCIHYNMHSIYNANMKANPHTSHTGYQHLRNNLAHIECKLQPMYRSNILRLISHNSYTPTHQYGNQANITCRQLHPHTLNNPLSMSSMNHMYSHY